MVSDKHACAPHCPTSHREHLNHMTDGRWHDNCRFCLRRRVKSGTGLEGEPVGTECGPSCWTPVNCPSCGSPLPPRGRSVPLAMTLAPCCDETRINETLNPRHLWNEEEAFGG